MFPNAKPRTPEVAVKHLLKTVENVGLADSGSYISEQGFDADDI